MQRQIYVDQLIDWLNRALKAKTIYHREREQLWDRFCKILHTSADIELTTQQYNSIKSFLVCRNEQLSENKELAFQTALEQLSDDTTHFTVHIQPEDKEQRLEHKDELEIKD